MAVKLGSLDSEKSLYLIQIQHLDEQLERFELKCVELERQHEDLTSQYRALERDQKVTTKHLKGILVTKEKMAEELDKELKELLLAAKKKRKALEKQHAQDMQELQGDADKLKEEIRVQAAKLKEQEEQLKQVELRLSIVNSLKEQLTCQKEEHKTAIETMAKENELKLKKSRYNMQCSAEMNLEAETSSILQEKQTLIMDWSQDFPVLQREVDVLQVDNNALQEREKVLCAERDEIKKQVKNITQERLSYKKDITQLRKKYICLGAALKDHKLTTQHLLDIEEDLRILALASEKNHHKTAELLQLEAELQRQRSRGRLLEGVKMDAAVILRHILKENAEHQNLCYAQSKLERLLQILESTASQENL